MVDVWLFGEFWCTKKISTQDTKDYRKTKWRSQTKVPKGSAVVGAYSYSDTYNWVNIKLNGVFQAHAIYVTDLEYQLRNTSSKSNSAWIKFTNSITRREFAEYRWYNLVSVIEYEVFLASNSSVNPNAANSNPANPSPANPSAWAFPKPLPTPKPLLDLGYLNFAEERLELGFDFGALGGMEFDTEIIEVASGKEQRNALRYLPLGRWQLGDRKLLESQIDQIAEVGYLKDFHRDRQGSYQGFRFKDWSDYQGFDQLIGYGDGVKTQFQLTKAYSVGNAIVYRPILKPVAESLTTVVSFLPIGFSFSFSLDAATGIVTFNTPLPPGAEFKASFEFDVPVWFESDQIGFRLLGYDSETNEAIYELESLFVVEGRIPQQIAINPKIIKQIEEPLDLGIIYETVEQSRFSTSKFPLKSGYMKRESKQSERRTSFNLGSRNYDRAEIDQILNYFWLAKGRNMSFPFRNLDSTYTARFGTDQLSLKFEGADETEQLFSLSGLKLEIIPLKGLIQYLDKETYLYFCIDDSGSIDDSLPAIYQAIYDWQQVLKVYIYGDDLYNKTQTVSYGDGAWLKLLFQYSKPKALYLIFSAEAAPIYHSAQTFTPYTSEWYTDLDSYLSTFGDRDFCKIIMHPISSPQSPYDIFIGQLFAAQEGLLGYSPPLKNYGLEIVSNIDPATSSFQWLDYFQEGSSIFG